MAVDEDVNPPTITVGINGKTAQANLPSGGKQVFTGTIESLISIDTESRRATVLEEFDIEYIGDRNKLGSTRVTVSPGTYYSSSSSDDYLFLGQAVLLDEGVSVSNMASCYIRVGLEDGSVFINKTDRFNGDEIEVSNSSGYRLFK